MLIITKKIRTTGSGRPGSPVIRIRPDLYHRCAAIAAATDRGLGEVAALLLEYALENTEIRTEDPKWND